MLSLNCPIMDGYHEEFEVLLVSFDGSNFLGSFEKLIAHTVVHFVHEEALMKEHCFQGFSEHKEEHQKILNELNYFYEMAQNGRVLFAKNYLQNGIEEHFDSHVRTIDSQLALFLKSHSAC